jgi:phosphatidate phosphatase PAH1
MLFQKRLQENEIEKLKELKRLGWTQNDLATKYNISRTTVRYHTDSDFKKTVKKNSLERKKLPEEKEKARIRMNERYRKDKEFRKKQIERSKKYNQKNQKKRKELQKRYREKNKEKLKEKRIKKKQKETRIAKILFGCFLLCCLSTLAIILILAGQLIWYFLGGG